MFNHTNFHQHTDGLNVNAKINMTEFMAFCMFYHKKSCTNIEEKKIITFYIKFLLQLKVDGVGPVDNRPSTE